MTRLEYLKDCKARYTNWLSMTSDELSKVGAGALTHEKVAPLLDAIEDELIDYIHLQVVPGGRDRLVYAEPEAR